MKASDVIKVWDVLRDTKTMKGVSGDGFYDLRGAIEQVVGIEDDLPRQQPEAPAGSPTPDDRLAKIEERILKLESQHYRY